MFGFACYFIYIQLNEKDFVSNFQEVSNHLLSTKGILLISCVFLLQFLNYTLEAVKWQQLVTLQYSVSLWTLVKSVYVGNSISIFTPNRVGSYLGRMIILHKLPKLFVAASSFLGNLAQLTITVFFGIIGFIFFVPEPFIFTNDFFLILFSVLTLFFLGVLFYGKKVLVFFNRFQWFLIYKDGLDFLSQVKGKVIAKVLSIAFLRYAVFVVEFWLILAACGIDVSFLETFIICGVVYAVSNFIPSPMMGNLGTREMVVLLVFGGSNVETNALTASLIIWLINIAFPSILGGLLLNFHRFKNSEAND